MHSNTLDIALKKWDIVASKADDVHQLYSAGPEEYLPKQPSARLRGGHH